MDQNLEMVSMTDLTTYHMPDGVFTGKTENIRSLDNDFLKKALLYRGLGVEVYQVKEKKTGAVYALKEIDQKNADLRRDERTSIKLFREISLLQSMNHENVIKLLHVYLETDPSKLLLLFELFPCNLLKYIELYPPERAVPIDQVKCISRQMLKGLNYLHKSQIVHRDIKPENLLISEGGQVKIADFGLCRRFSHLNKPSTPATTSFYQAPEILLGAISYDEKVDIWSAGCVLIEIITKRPFFNGKSDLEQLRLISEVLGQATYKNMPKLSDCRAARQIAMPGTPYNKLTDRLTQVGCPVHVSELLCNVITWEPSKRLSAEECILDDWFETAPFPSTKVEFPAASARTLAIK